jgi:hypothetical protein
MMRCLLSRIATWKRFRLVAMLRKPVGMGARIGSRVRIEVLGRAGKLVWAEGPRSPGRRTPRRTLLDERWMRRMLCRVSWRLLPAAR